MFIIFYRKIFFIISAFAVAAALVLMFSFGFNAGIDFTGGAILEAEYPGGRPDVGTLAEAVKKEFPDAIVQTAGEKGVFVRTRDLADPEHTKLLSALSLGGTAQVSEKQFNSIGPTIGRELRQKAWLAIAAVLLAIMCFIAFAFRKVSEPISSWRYGGITLVGLAHDIIIPAGLFAYLGKEVNSLFVVALLSILGISVHDKIVVFDRVRENLKLKISKSFEETVGKSLEQTFTRSVNTSLTTLFVLFALWFWGPASTRDFALLLFTGVAIGTYSSVFFATPLLVTLEKWQKQRA
ncbi:MAG: protein translocase subunit SecF [bacterium]|nr:protein translocase subunit SecF [bacterium]